ncbi:ABC transporter permease [Pseudoalteromonas sp. R3]|uniref:ABC transporter permease n=1 Tax=Pseudoalteromonas sp. R3 TaxID=1709477 RepID=UPI0006B449AE|nr:ABC transporter permease [Pseudoalteromonas sp. R3]AZZ98670.1 FtsX-like permease family protein [Pseudoalteromonas sp. R3]
MIEDIQYTLRRLLKAPRFTALTLFVMTTGLALCIYMFSFIQSTIQAPLPFSGGERMVRITINSNGTIYDGPSVRLHEYLELKQRLTTVDAVDAFAIRGANLSTGDRALRYRAHLVTPELFSLSGGRAVLGRLLSDADMLPGQDKVVVLGYALWQELFAGDANVVGKTLTVNGTAHTIIGVSEQGYRFPSDATLYLPFSLSTQGLDRKDSPYVAMYARLKPGTERAELAQEVAQYFNQLRQAHPQLNSNVLGHVWTFQDELVGSGGTQIVATMYISVFMILLLACVNVGNLLLSRALENTKETAIRSALGAPRATLIKQMLIESTLISVLSGTFAILLAGWGVEVSVNYFATAMPIEMPYWWHANFTQSSLLVAFAIVIATALLTGLLPAWRATSTDINTVLRDGTRGAQGQKNARLSKLIVALEVALSCALIMVSAAMVNGIDTINRADYGMRTTNYITARVQLPDLGYESEDSRRQYFSTLSTLILQQSEIDQVTMASSMAHTWGAYNNFAIEGQDYGRMAQYPAANLNVIANNFFEMLDVTLIAGRRFNNQDNKDAPKVVIVTQSFASQFFPAGSALGKRIRYVEQGDDWFTIVGVVNDVILGQPTGNNLIRTTTFVPFEQMPRSYMHLAIQGKGKQASIRQALERAALKADPSVPPYRVMSIEPAVAERVAGMNFVSKVFTLFALASMVIAFSGIYAVMANAIAQKQQEVGIRRALGASDSEILIHFIWQGSKQLGVGLMFGLPAGFALVNLMTQAGLAQSHPLITLGVPLLIATVILAAIMVPVNAALRLEPAAALRDE